MSLKIKTAQLDPNGLCNAGCWYCPVAYQKNPEVGKKNMPISMLESIVKQLHDGIGTFVDERFHFVYTAHYNEVILYPHFEEMIAIFKKYNFKTMILTNGIGLSQAKVDFIKANQDTILGICLNIPAAESALWAKFTNMNEKIFNRLISNVEYAYKELPNMVMSKTLSIQVNGMSERSLPENGGWMELLGNGPAIDLTIGTGDLDRTLELFRQQFPGMHVYSNEGLVDRAGFLDQQGIMSNSKAIEKYAKQGKEKVIGCNNMGGRADTWVHINANGDLFICCNDYDFNHVFGNVLEDNIKDIWMSDRHKEMIAHTYKTLCTTCSHSVWG